MKLLEFFNLESSHEAPVTLQQADIELDEGNEGEFEIETDDQEEYE